MFYKISANGNAFIVIYESANTDIKKYREIYPDVDGLIHLSPSRVASANFRIYNKDGSIAKICGNGLLCSAIFLKESLEREENTFTFLTDNGFYKAGINGLNYYADFDIPEIISYDDEIGIVDAGNLHQIRLVEVIDPDNMIDEKTRIPQGFNLHHLNRRGENLYMMLSLERGVGFTKCCGSGSVSAFVYLHALNPELTKLNIQTLGGLIKVSLHEGKIRLEGRGRIIYKGMLYEKHDIKKS